VAQPPGVRSSPGGDRCADCSSAIHHCGRMPVTGGCGQDSWEVGMQTPRMPSTVRTAAPLLTDAGVGVGVAVGVLAASAAGVGPGGSAALATSCHRGVILVSVQALASAPAGGRRWGSSRRDQRRWPRAIHDPRIDQDLARSAAAGTPARALAEPGHRPGALSWPVRLRGRRTRRRRGLAAVPAPVCRLGRPLGLCDLPR
jgi:hypothetical protein